MYPNILNKTIADNYAMRHMFEDLLKLADRDGKVNLQPGALSRAINLPLPEVDGLLEKLMVDSLIGMREGCIEILDFEVHSREIGAWGQRHYARTYKRSKGAKRKAPSVIKDSLITVPDDAWVASLKQEKAYEGIDVEHQFQLFRVWYTERKRKPTRRRFQAWLARCDREILVSNGSAQPKPFNVTDSL